MPVKIENTDGYLTYSPVHIGPAEFVLSEQLDVSALDSDQIDAEGFIIPGAILKLAGQQLVPLEGAATDADEADFTRVVLFPVKVAEGNAAGQISAAADVDVVVLTHGTLDRGIMEDNLGRALNAAEIAALNASNLVITDPVA